MYLLQLKSDYHYEGTDILSVCVSESKEKLESLIDIATVEFIQKDKQFREIQKKYMNVGGIIFKNVDERDKAIQAFAIKRDECFNTFKTLTELKIQNHFWDSRTDSFEIIEIVMV